MNRLTVLIVALAFILASCIKEQVSIEEPELILETESDVLTRLNMHNNMLSYDIMLPAEREQTSVRIHINSFADPEGYTFQEELKPGSYHLGGKEFFYLRATGSIQAASYSNPKERMIKVASSIDEISLNAEDGLIQKSMAFDGRDALTITYHPGNDVEKVNATITLYTYNNKEADHPELLVSSSHDPKKITLSGKTNNNLDENPFPIHTFEVDFQRYTHTSENILGITDSCELYIEYKGVTYISVFENNNNLTLLPLIK